MMLVPPNGARFEGVLGLLKFVQLASLERLVPVTESLVSLGNEQLLPRLLATMEFLIWIAFTSPVGALN